MSYEVTAIKKRPQNFDQIVGQEFIVSALKNSVEQERIAHAYLFSGPRGVGKTSAARILAKALNCEQGLTTEPCGKCTSCIEIVEGRSFDVIEIDGASHTSVNDVREIRDEVLFAPTNFRYKVYIIDEVHMLSNSAFNALLKTIEEPPPHVVFIFATTEIHKVPATIRSRCQQFNFRLISLTDIKTKIQEVAKELNIRSDNESLVWIAKEATGSLRDAYTLFDQIISFSGNEIQISKIQEKLGIVGVEEISKLIRLLAEGNINQVLKVTDGILNKGISEEQFVIGLAEYFRNLLFIKHGITKESFLGCSFESFSKEIIDSFSIEQIEKALDLLLHLYRNFRFSLNQKFELELLLSRLGSLEKLITPSEILNTIQTLKQKLQTKTLKTVPEESETVQAANRSHIVVPQDILKNIIDTIGKKKLTLASSLKKCTLCKIVENDLMFFFQEKDAFSAEFVMGEKTILSQIASQITGNKMGIKVEILKENQTNASAADEEENIIKKVFKGTVIKGD
ncbi:MAG: DNA polymerase III subunit gamma/tau [Spirochaetales bacterium]|nr:DNA polymerase III subunit gamma/tau [Spirochaetales bacterium]